MVKKLMTITLLYDTETKKMTARTDTSLPPDIKKQLLEEFAQTIQKQNKEN
jgi:hypothetical protein